MSENNVCPHCGAKQTSSTKTCLSCGMDKTKKANEKKNSWIMRHINAIRWAVILIIILLNVCSSLIEKYYYSTGIIGNILTITGYTLIVIFVIFLIILLLLDNKNCDDSSEELSEYKKKHTNTFITK